MFPAAHGVVSQGRRGAPPPLLKRGGPSLYRFHSWQIDAAQSGNVGWRFTALNGITVTHLRLYHHSGTQTSTVYLYRHEDGALLASAPVTATSGWGETAIPPVTLEVGKDYVVSHYAGGAARTTYFSNAPLIDPAIAHVGNSLYGNSSAMPSTVFSSITWHNAASFRSAAPAVGYRFFRLAVTTNNGRSTTNLAELELRVASGGPRWVGPANIWASSVFGGGLSEYAANNAVDQDPSTYWSTEANTIAADLVVDVGTGNELQFVEYALQARADASNGAPRDWTLEGSNDLETWSVLDAVVGETGWASGETRVFTI